MRKQTAWFSEAETVPLLLERCAETRPEHVFCRLGDEVVTCAGLNARVNRAAHGLAARGVVKGAHIAVMLGHHLDHITIFFALMKLGAVQVPINVNLKGPGLAYIVDHAAPVLVIADAEYAGSLDPILAERPAIAQLWRERAGGRHAARRCPVRSRRGAIRASRCATTICAPSSIPPVRRARPRASR
jgi:crotonobetaine/carnitine-CoA ligase